MIKKIDDRKLDVEISQTLNKFKIDKWHNNRSLQTIVLWKCAVFIIMATIGVYVLFYHYLEDLLFFAKM